MPSPTGARAEARLAEKTSRRRRGYSAQPEVGQFSAEPPYSLKCWRSVRRSLHYAFVTASETGQRTLCRRAANAVVADAVVFRATSDATGSVSEMPQPKSAGVRHGSADFAQ